MRKLRARQMPPVGKPRPNEASYAAVVAYLEGSLDRAAAAHPNPGRTATIRRLTRTEYRNAVRDLLAVDVDVSSLLPSDESSYGFDNVTVGDLSPTLLDRYLSAAEKISRLAVGRPSRAPGGETIRVPADLTQEGHIDGLPIGTRGGTVARLHLPAGRRVRVPDPADAGSRRARRGLERAARGRAAARSRSRAGLHGETAAGRGGPRHGRSTPEDAGPRSAPARMSSASRSSRSRRCSRKGRVSRTRRASIPTGIRASSRRSTRCRSIGPYGAAGSGDTPSRRRIFVSRPAAPDRRRGARGEADPDVRCCAGPTGGR